jgi:hypothetical protein
MQVEAQKKFMGGMVGGPVFSQISGDGLGGWDKLGFSVGAWVGVPLSDKNNISMSMRYITKGSRTKRDTLEFNSFAYHLNYLDVPILFQHNFLIRQSNFSWSAGPVIGLLLNQKVKVNKVDRTVPEAGQGPEFDPLDIGLMGSITAWVSPKFYIELSTSTSVIPTRPAPLVVNKTSYYEQGNYNQTLQLMFGLRFGGG